MSVSHRKARDIRATSTSREADKTIRERRTKYLTRLVLTLYANRATLRV